MAGSIPSNERFHLLDGMRGLAAFAVIVDHVPSDTLRALLPGRHLAVDFFFVLSGLVLAKAYGAALTQPGSAWRFLKVRLIRLYPMYFAGFVLGLIVALLTWGNLTPLRSLASIFAALLFLPSPGTYGQSYDLLYPLDPPAWSLFFELVANFAWALCAGLFRGRARYVVLLAFALWAGFSVYYAPVPGAGWQWSHLSTGLARVLFSFFTGVTLYSLLGEFRLPKIPVVLPLVLFGLVLIWPPCFVSRPAFDVLAMLVIIPATVLLGARVATPKVVAPACDWLGKVSYGVYVLHVPLFLLMTPAFRSLHVSPTIQALILAVVAALATQIATRFYEAPVQKRLKSWFLANK